MLTITIHDTNTERYTYTASASVLGRRYDNIAEHVTVIKPESETERDCIMIVTYGDTVVDHIPVGDTPIAITSNLSQYASVKIGFAFLGADGYIKNSEVKEFFFLTAQKPDGFVPLPPVQKTTIDYLISHGFTGAKLENNILSFTNAAGNTVVEIKLSGFIQEQADWNETNTTAETYIKNKPTKLSQFTNDSGFVTGTDISRKADKSYVDTELAKKQPIGDYATVEQLNQGLAEKQPTGDYALKSEIPDVSQFITKTVNDLVYYYTKTQVDNMVSEIPKFSIKVVDALPYENISSTTVYLLRNDGDAGNLYTEYIYVDGAWETLGTQTVDLSGYVTSTTFTAHTGNKNNPHGVTAEQVGAYVKPSDGIPESDLSAEVQAKLNSGGGGAENLLKGDVTVTVADGSLNALNELGYPLGISADKSYKVTIDYNGENKDIIIKSSDWQKLETAVGAVVGINTWERILVYDGMSADYSINPNTSFLGIDRASSGSLSVVFKSITEYTEVIADKVKNKLTITVNGEAKEYDGSEAVEVDINTGSADNLLKNEVTVTLSVGSSMQSQELDYLLAFEEGKKYIVSLTYNGEEKQFEGTCIPNSGMYMLADTFNASMGLPYIIENQLYGVVAAGAGSDMQPSDSKSLIGVTGNVTEEAVIIFKSIKKLDENIVRYGISVQKGETMASVVTKITNTVAVELTSKGKTSVIATILFNGLMISDAVSNGNANNRAFIEIFDQTCSSRVTKNSMSWATPLIRAFASDNELWGSGNWAVRVDFGKDNSNIGVSTGVSIPDGLHYEDLSNFVSDGDAKIDIIIY